KDSVAMLSAPSLPLRRFRQLRRSTVYEPFHSVCRPTLESLFPIETRTSTCHHQGCFLLARAIAYWSRKDPSSQRTRTARQRQMRGFLRFSLLPRRYFYSND